ncbi:HTH-type transcriptional regulator MalT [compost metagenome]
MMGKLFSMFRSQPAAADTGQAALAPAAEARLGAKADPGIDKLSAREREILALIARGGSNKQIARDLDIAETTVKIHVQHILRKLNLSSRVQAAVYAAGHGMG